MRTSVVLSSEAKINRDRQEQKLIGWYIECWMFATHQSTFEQVGQQGKKSSLKGRNRSPRYEEAEGDIEDFNLTCTRCKGECRLASHDGQMGHDVETSINTVHLHSLQRVIARPCLKASILTCPLNQTSTIPA
jgi:hypothetical protein